MGCNTTSNVIFITIAALFQMSCSIYESPGRKQFEEDPRPNDNAHFEAPYNKPHEILTQVSFDAKNCKRMANHISLKDIAKPTVIYPNPNDFSETLLCEL